MQALLVILKLAVSNEVGVVQMMGALFIRFFSKLFLVN